VSRKYDIDFIKNEFAKEGYELLSTEYKNSNQKLDYICPNGHTYKSSWRDWLRGHRCAVCAGNAKYNISMIRVSFEKERYDLLSKEYKNSTQKLDYVCPKGHKHRISLRDWNRGHRCPYCAGRPIITIEEVTESFEKEGYTLLTKEYVNVGQKLYYICPEGHKYYTNWRKWNSHGYRCPYCHGNAKKTIDVVRNDVEMNGYALLTSEYINCDQKLHLVCPNGHDYIVTWDNWNHNKSRCPKCSESGTSLQELDVCNFIKSKYTGNIISNSYDIITPKELDIVIPEKKIAIEYCGLYWHSELTNKDRHYHLDKLNRTTAAGYNLVTIFEDEWINKNNIVISRISNALGINKSEKIYARQCEIREISSSTASDFCNKHHLQGYTGSKIKLGLFYKNKIVSVMTFSKLSISKGSKNKEGSWELSRFCSDIHYRVIGGASKLLSYFEKNYQWNEIISYADRRWSSGNLYEKIGFTLVGETKPNYWYFKGRDLKRIHRFALRKNSTDPKDQTEWEIRKSQGWNRIWDCGNLKYVKYKKI
jgi:hypothetical protein